MSDGKTHWEGCWKERGHHECAVLRVEELEAERDEASRRSAIDQEQADTMTDEAGRLAERVAELEAEIERLRQWSYPHVCRAGHPEVGHAESSSSSKLLSCPVCRERAEIERLRGLIAAVPVVWFLGGVGLSGFHYEGQGNKHPWLDAIAAEQQRQREGDGA